MTLQERIDPPVGGNSIRDSARTDMPDFMGEQGQPFERAAEETAKAFNAYARRIRVEPDASGWASFDLAGFDQDDAAEMTACLEPMIGSAVQEFWGSKEHLHQDFKDLRKAVFNRIQSAAEHGVWVAGDAGDRLFFPTFPWMGAALFKAPSFRSALQEAIARKSRGGDVESQPETRHQQVESIEEPPDADRRRSVGQYNKSGEVAWSGNKRLSASITSLTAAKRMEAYMASTGIGQTEFAIKVGTTDRTLRNFRKTGKIQRKIFDAIAEAMGITREELLRPE